MFVQVKDGFTAKGITGINGIFVAAINETRRCSQRQKFRVSVMVDGKTKGTSIFVDNQDQATFLNDLPNGQNVVANLATPATIAKTAIAKAVNDSTAYEDEYRANESESQAMDRITTNFSIMNEMTDSVCSGDVTSLIISGPAGVGKSFTVHEVVDDYASGQVVVGAYPTKERVYTVVKGSVTPIALYKILYEYSDNGNVIVFDDCDSLFYDDVSLNLLKAALDTDRTRRLGWYAESYVLKKEDIPKQFNFRGTVVFLTNLNFNTIRSPKLKPHLEALQSRSLYLDLEIGQLSDKLLRIKHLVANGLYEHNRMDVNEEQRVEVIDFITEYIEELNEVSIRTAIKIGGLMRSNPTEWRKMAVYTMMKREAKFKFLLDAKA